MNEIVSATLKIVAAMGLVLALFWLLKHRTRTSIEPTDKSMDTSTFPDGGYSVDTSAETRAAIKSGDFVAFHNPKDPTGTRIARVIGVQGDRVEINSKGVMVNGAAMPKRYDMGTWTIPETKIPRGCAYILCDDSFSSTSIDSRQAGPLPFTSIVGTVKPSR